MLFVLSADKPCTLFCTPVGRDAPVLVADRVMDGTPCGPYESDLCVNGRCQVGPLSLLLLLCPSLLSLSLFQRSVWDTTGNQEFKDTPNLLRAYGTLLYFFWFCVTVFLNTTVNQKIQLMVNSEYIYGFRHDYSVTSKRSYQKCSKLFYFHYKP